MEYPLIVQLRTGRMINKIQINKSFGCLFSQKRQNQKQTKMKARAPRKNAGCAVDVVF
ncbi:hypothetical protein M5D96_007002 [Drosophila gunungcola]|uniref:Uncharacterized protein n=1 Tax=Drosophila gunungcola TaxID=103775 RepID=A0A9P9YMF1_9MUSC|nr:hypothetical protein M5D96_007002 [Drosophila gunungcola]